eukprot:SAG11_NODE_24447_length_373_cov_0.748175_1_plen_81_part_01
MLQSSGEARVVSDSDKYFTHVFDDVLCSLGPLVRRVRSAELVLLADNVCRRHHYAGDRRVDIFKFRNDAAARCLCCLRLCY